MENSGSDLAPVTGSVAPKKDRHVVTWSPQEDELLREQIAIHGTNSWTSISANFKDKTSRQCRRRWYTYLNSEFKKGGWSPEEDMLLCEAQKILGNKWTEIAKVVSGRTDNAVKNRFSTLCKKRARNEALYKENIVPSSNADNNRALDIRNRLISAGIGEPSTSHKQIRYDISNSSEKMRKGDTLELRELMERKPLSELSQNNGNSKAPLYNVSGTDSKGTFLKRDDPKLATLFQQAELLSSLAIKVNTGNSKERFDEAWKLLQEYLIQTEGKEGMLEKEMSDVTSLLDDLKDLIEDLRSSNEENLQIGPHDLIPQLQMDASRSVEDQNLENFTSCDNLIDNEVVCPGEGIQICENLEGKDGNCCTKNFPDSNFHSPVQKFPAFLSADSIPSPKFSESERKFLLTVLGMDSPNSNPDGSKPPSCKRALL